MSMSCCCSTCGITHQPIDIELVQVDPNGVTRWSPDGDGYYYDDSLEEALANHPDGEDARVIYLSESFDEYDTRTERH